MRIMNRYTNFFVFILLGVLFILACTKDKTPEIAPITGSVSVSDCVDTIRFSNEIQDMINVSCIGCHDSGGTSPDLSDYSRTSSNASAIYGTINSGSMPQGGAKLSDSIIQSMKCWIDQGKLNN